MNILENVYRASPFVRTNVEVSFRMRIHPQRIGKYELHKLLGSGGMAEVWQAFDIQLHRYVAIKLLHPDLQATPDFIARFEREARISASLHHPNIVQIHDFQVSNPPEVDSTIAYMVMDYIDGQTLSDYINSTSRRGIFPSASEIVYLFTSISLAVDYAHQHGMIHRDIKPANILLDKRYTNQNVIGEPMLTDFGIAKLLGISTGASSGSWLGTALYISPEQASGYIGNERSDLYSLGVILYEICTGTLPFHGEDSSAIMRQHIHAMPPSPALINPNISPDLASVIMRGLAKDPAMRFASASSMTVALAEAFHQPVPEKLSLPAYVTNDMSEPTYYKPLRSTLLPNGVPSTPQIVKYPSVPTNSPNPTLSPDALLTTANPFGARSAHSVLELPTIASRPVATPSSSPVEPTLIPKNRRKRHIIVLLSLLVLLLIGSVLGALHLFLSNPTAFPTGMIVGQASFISSADITRYTTRGVYDELLLQLNNISDPDKGESYYAWLLSDTNRSPITTVFLGNISVKQGKIDFLYKGDQAHNSLIGNVSRLVIAEEKTQGSASSTLPLPDHSNWRYYGELPQAPLAVDMNHLSMLDHLRDLVTEDSLLQSVRLPGGLDIWLATNTEKVLEWAGSARDYWGEQGSTTLMHNHFVRILDYLDGIPAVQGELPPGADLLLDTSSCYSWSDRAESAGCNIPYLLA